MKPAVALWPVQCEYRKGDHREFAFGALGIRHNYSDSLFPTIRLISKRLRLQQSKAGVGVFTSATLSRGHFICLYAGEFISQEQARRRFLKQDAEGIGNYMLCMRENNVVIGFVDPTSVGNIG